MQAWSAKETFFKKHCLKILFPNFCTVIKYYSKQLIIFNKVFVLSQLPLLCILEWLKHCIARICFIMRKQKHLDVPLSSRRIFSGFMSRCVIPMLWRYSCKWERLSSFTTRVDMGWKVWKLFTKQTRESKKKFSNHQKLTTPAINCWKNLCASFSGIPTSGSVRMGVKWHFE